MSDHIRVNGNNNVQAPVAQDNVQNDAPQEIARAKTSKLSVALRVIAGVFTLGISEGIRFIVNKCRVSEPRGNQVHPQNPAMVPAANPEVDLANQALSDSIVKNNIPDNIKIALSEVAHEYRNTYGNKAVPEELYSFLESPGKNGRPMVLALRNAINSSQVEITAENIKPIFDNIVKENIQFLGIKAVIAEKCENTGIPLGPSALQSLTNEFMSKKNEQHNIDNLDDARAFVADIPEENEIISMHQMKYITSSENLKRDKIFPENNVIVKAVKKVIREFDEKFNGFLKSDKIEELLNKPSSKNNTFVYAKLTSLINHAQNVNDITQEQIEAEIYEHLDADLKDHGLRNILNNKFAQAEIPLFSDALKTSYIDVLRKDIPEFENDVNNAKNTQELTEVVNKHSNLIDVKLNEIKANINEIENRYLGEVNDELKPVLKQMIRCVLFDNDNKQQSEIFIHEQVQYMKNWKNFEYSDSLAASNEMLNHIQIDLSHLEGDPAPGETQNKYKDNLYTTFIADSTRFVYIINDEEMPRQTEPVTGKVKSLLTNPLDLQFVTKLANQRLYANVANVQHFDIINGEKIGIDGNTFKYEGTEQYYNDQSKVIEADNPIGTDFKKDHNQTFKITISEDKKTGTVEFIKKVYLTTRNKPIVSFGSLTISGKYNFTLAAGNQFGFPTLDSMKVSQTFGNPF